MVVAHGVAELLDGSAHRLDPRVALVWGVTAAAAPVVAALVATGVFVSIEAGSSWIVLALVAGAVLAVVAFAWARAAWARYSWAAGGTALDLRHGVVVRRESLVPYHRIQQIDVVRDPLERVLGLSTLVLRTASASTDGKIPGLPQQVADTLRDGLLTRAGVDDAV